MDGAQVTQPAGGVTAWFHRTRLFLLAVRDEMGRVTWPTKPELIKATRMIVVFSIVLGLVIGFMDLLLQVVLVDFVARLAR